MEFPDINVWLALTLSGHSHHASARAWLEGQQVTDSIFFCRSTQEGLVRLLTTAEMLHAYELPLLTNREAWAVVENFMEDERITFANEPSGVADAWKTFAIRDTNFPKLWMDSWLAALPAVPGGR